MGRKSSRERGRKNDSDETETESSAPSSNDERDSTEPERVDDVGRIIRRNGLSKAEGSVQRSATGGHGSAERRGRGSDGGYVSYDPGPDRQALGEQYGIEVREGTARRLQRLEAEFGSERVSRLAEEGMTVETMGKPRDMQAFRKRQEARPEEVPTDIERRNESSKQRNEEQNREGGPAGETQVPDVVRSVVSSPGRSMDETVQREMEAKMGGDFSDVQVHSGPTAAAAAESINARAFTVGNHVAFNRGEYQPEKSEGKRVLAHELTHVRQQTEGAVSLLPKAESDPATDSQLHVQPTLAVGSPSDTAEREAERIADQVVEMSESSPIERVDSATRRSGYGDYTEQVQRQQKQVQRQQSARTEREPQEYETTTLAEEGVGLPGEIAALYGISFEELQRINAEMDNQWDGNPRTLRADETVYVPRQETGGDSDTDQESESAEIPPSERIEELSQQWQDGEIEMPDFARGMKPFADSHGEEIVNVIYNDLWAKNRDNFSYGLANNSSDSELNRFDEPLLEAMAATLNTWLSKPSSWEKNKEQRKRVLEALDKEGEEKKGGAEDESASEGGGNGTGSQSLTTYSAPEIEPHGNETVVVHEDFVDAMDDITDFAAEENLKIIITHTFREGDQNLEGTVVEPAENSNHLVGHAIDMNLRDRENGVFHNSDLLANPNNCTENVQNFIENIENHSELRWGGNFGDPVHIDDGFNHSVSQEEYNTRFEEMQREFKNRSFSGSSDIDGEHGGNAGGESVPSQSDTEESGDAPAAPQGSQGYVTTTLAEGDYGVPGEIAADYGMSFDALSAFNANQDNSWNGDARSLGANQEVRVPTEASESDGSGQGSGGKEEDGGGGQPETPPSERIEELSQQWQNSEIKMPDFAREMKPFADSHGEKIVDVIYNDLWAKNRDNFSYALANNSSDSELNSFEEPLLETMASTLNTWLSKPSSWEKNKEQRKRVLEALDKEGEEKKGGAEDEGETEERGEDRLIFEDKVQEAFTEKIQEIASDLGADPDHLMAIMNVETMGTFSSSIENDDTGATGLIQFIEGKGATVVDVSTDELADMSAVEQLDIVHEYFKKQHQTFGGDISSLDDLYMLVFWPAAADESSDTVIGAQNRQKLNEVDDDRVPNVDDKIIHGTYESNDHLDANGDGTITKSEAAGKVQDSLEKGGELLETASGGSAQEQEQPEEDRSGDVGGSSGGDAGSGSSDREKHTVESGDTLAGIASEYGIDDWKKVARWNNIDPQAYQNQEEYIHPGNELFVEPPVAEDQEKSDSEKPDEESGDGGSGKPVESPEQQIEENFELHRDDELDLEMLAVLLCPFGGSHGSQIEQGMQNKLDADVRDVFANHLVNAAEEGRGPSGVKLADFDDTLLESMKSNIMDSWWYTMGEDDYVQSVKSIREALGSGGEKDGGKGGDEGDGSGTVDVDEVHTVIAEEFESKSDVLESAFDEADTELVPENFPEQLRDSADRIDRAIGILDGVFDDSDEEQLYYQALLFPFPRPNVPRETVEKAIEDLSTRKRRKILAAAQSPTGKREGAQATPLGEGRGKEEEAGGYLEATDENLKDFFSELDGYLNHPKFNFEEEEILNQAQDIQAAEDVYGGEYLLLPPRELWDNIKDTFEMLGYAADESGCEIEEIRSSYRSAFGNIMCEGAEGSMHQNFSAVDIGPADRSLADYLARNGKTVPKEVGTPGIGIKIYSDTHIHIDTRTSYWVLDDR